jgi:NADPH2:quinone reductase
MWAWRVHALGEPADALHLDEGDLPQPGPGEVRVRVEAAGVNFPDLLLCRGSYQERPELPFTPGIEVAGEVVAAGEGAAYTVGQRVVGAPRLPCGGMAEQVVLSDARSFPIPAEMPAADAGGFFVTYQTAWVGLHRRADLRAGETLLVHGGAGGVGSAAIGLAKAAGATVIATAGGERKRASCLELGADVAVDYTAEDFVAVVKEATGGRGADVVWDPVGGDVFDSSRRCVAFEGRMVVVGFASGRIPAVAAGHVLVKNYAVLGLSWGAYLEREPALVRQAHDALLGLYAGGAVRPRIDSAVPFREAPAALTRLASRQVVGKLVLVP